MQILLAGREREEAVVVLELNTRSNIKVAKPPIFNRDTSKVLKFLMVCRLYIRMRMRNTLVEKQI